MNSTNPDNKNTLKVISALQKPQRQGLSTQKPTNEVKQVRAIHNLQPLCRTRANSNNLPNSQQIFIVPLIINHHVVPMYT